MHNKLLILIASLEKVLIDLVGQHQRLLVLLEQQRDAFRHGDADGLAELCRLQDACVRGITDRERERVRLVLQLSQLVSPDVAETAKPLRLAELAELLPEPARARVLELRGRLIAVMREVQERSSVLRRAGEAMIGHVNALIRTIGTVSRGGSAYGLTGRSGTRPAALRSIHLTA